MVRSPLLTGSLVTLVLFAAAPAADADFGPADYVKRVQELRRGAPAGFTIVVQPPFVVIGDEVPAVVEQRARGTVKWAADQLQRAYFAKPPAQIIDVWLLRDVASYTRQTLRLFGERPGTPYGFYSAAKHALVMNIATGGGTLVHEMVHPFVESNFPSCPAWLNEGLGSLYEQSSERGGQIIGLTNWRLAGLQAAIRRGRLPSFKTLTGTTRSQFYDDDPGTNYAQARYLLYHLQERGLLRTFYREAHAGRVKDPTGYVALQRVLGARDMTAFQREWQQQALKLRFP